MSLEDYLGCLLGADGAVRCWGTALDQYDPVEPTLVPSLSGVIQVSVGLGYACARTSGDGVKCWGHNQHGNLGDGTTEERLRPVAVSGLTNALEISAGAFHACAVLSDGTVRCWGNNRSGQLGDGTQGLNAISSTPVPVSGLRDVIHVAAGEYYTCVERKNGDVMCWGYNGFGALGTGTTQDEIHPVLVDLGGG
ncbi:MAG TPA: hypothetical protein VFQ61_12540 [Polyangiaceae bacterium]|nr:hypothetical protein [Polyangiaceae bacterium]